MNALIKVKSPKSIAFAKRSDQDYRSLAAWIKPQQNILVSFVVVVQNNCASLQQFAERVKNHSNSQAFEIILVDDGSTDGSWRKIQELADLHPYIRGLQFRSERGTAAALQAGFDIAEGELIFSMSADRLDDPQHIPRFIGTIEEGYDVVSGRQEKAAEPQRASLAQRWREHFQRNEDLREECEITCFRQEVAKSIILDGKLHLMAPSLARIEGYRVTELTVQSGSSSNNKPTFGFEKLIRGFSAMLKLGFLRALRRLTSHPSNFCAVSYVFTVACLIASVLLVCILNGGGVATSLAALSFFGMGGACTIAGLFCDLMRRQDSPAQVSHPNPTSNLPRLTFQKATPLISGRTIHGQARLC